MDVKNTLLDNNEDYGCDGGILMATAVCLYFGSNRGSSHTGWDSPSVADFYINVINAVQLYKIFVSQYIIIYV